MLKERYESWLKSRGISSYINYISRLETMEKIYGDIDLYYENDGCSSLLAEFEYTTSDRLNRRKPKHRIPITPGPGKDEYESYYEGTKDYSSRLRKYIEFRKSDHVELLGAVLQFDGPIRQENSIIQTEAARQPLNIIPKRNSRYKGNPVGNAQNLVIRTILSNLGDESFSEKDWEETKSYFEGKCAYCGTADKEIVRDHAIPINRYKLGEHKLGNLVPACRHCNNAKGEQDYIEFCGENEKAITQINAYIESRNYRPLTADTDKSQNIQIILHHVYEEIRVVAERYIKLINDLFFSSPYANEDNLAHESIDLHTGKTDPPTNVGFPRKEFVLSGAACHENEFEKHLRENNCDVKVTLFYQDRKETKLWQVRNFSKDSKLNANLSSGYLRGWQEKGIIGIKLEV